MEIENILYYLFTSIIIVSAIMVVGSHNPVHSVLFLVLSFTGVGGLLLMPSIAADYAAFLFIAVYVGAIAVLFLFVVMMLSTHNIKKKGKELITYIPLGLLVGVSLSLEVFVSISTKSTEVLEIQSKTDLPESIIYATSWIHKVDNWNIIQKIASLLYTEYAVHFLIAGCILLLAMVSAIHLSLHVRKDLETQKIYNQVGRDYQKTISALSIIKPSNTK